MNCGNFDPRQGFPTSPEGLIVHISAAREVQIVATGLAFPNGMAFSPDGRTLIVAESHAARLSAFGIEDDGTLRAAETWAEIPGYSPDGICTDPTGACWFADVPRQCVVRVAHGGKLLNRFDLDRGAFSCCLAEDNARLYVTAAHWPGGQRMMDPTFDWDGTVYAIPIDKRSPVTGSNQRSVQDHHCHYNADRSAGARDLPVVIDVGFEAGGYVRSLPSEFGC